MKIICISGKAQHGKDTVAGMLQQFAADYGQSSCIVHYGDLLKYICTQFFDWDGSKDEYGRRLLQTIGTDNIRKKEPDFWVNFLCKLAGFFSNDWDYWFVADCRFPNEIDTFRQAGFDTVHLRVERENFTTNLTEEQQNHISETALDKSNPDFIIKNDGSLDDLNAKVFEVFKHINNHN